VVSARSECLVVVGGGYIPGKGVGAGGAVGASGRVGNVDYVS